MTREDLDKIHKHSIYNEEEVKNSKKCGCFYCGNIYIPVDVSDYTTEHNGKKTAWCPFCGIDSVIGDASGYEITEELLKGMNEVFF